MKEMAMVCSVCGQKKIEGDREMCAHCGGAWKPQRKSSPAALVLGILSFVFSAFFIVVFFLLFVIGFFANVFTLGQIGGGVEILYVVGFLIIGFNVLLALAGIIVSTVHTAMRRKLAIAGLVLSVLALGANIANVLIIISFI